MKSIEIKEKNIENAIEAGLKELDTTIDNVDIEILEEGRTGFFNLMGTHYVKIKMSLKNEVLKPSDLLSLIKLKVEYILKLMNFNLEVRVTIFGGRILVDLLGKDASLIIGRSGEVLDAFEEILNLIVSKEQKNRVKIDMDVDNYRKERELKIKSMLKNVIEAVATTGKTYKMRPMSRRDRKIIHTFLEKYEDLECVSEGLGKDRYITIFKKIKKNRSYYEKF